ALYVRVIDDFPTWLDRLPKVARPALPVLALGVTGVVALRFPEVLGNGYDAVNTVLFNQVGLGLLIILPLCKMLLTGLCAGAGVPGGLFTPSLFFGALLGGALGHFAGWLWPGSAPPGTYALLGMAGVLAGTTHGAVSAVLILFELTGDYDLILPLMLVCAVSAEVSRRVERDSIYTAVLRRRNIALPEVPRPEWLRVTRVGERMRVDVDR